MVQLLYESRELRANAQIRTLAGTLCMWSASYGVLFLLGLGEFI